MKNILAIETSTEQCSVALVAGAHHVTRQDRAPKAHSDLLLSWIKEGLAELGVSMDDLDGIVVGQGPGGFTGLRIGLSVAQGLSLAHDLPIYPVPSLLNVASCATAGDHILVVMDARMGEVYTQAFQRDPSGGLHALGEPAVMDPSMLSLPSASGAWCVLGSGLSSGSGFIERSFRPHAVAWDDQALPTALQAIELRAESVKPWELTPLYVRNQVTHGSN